LWILARLRRFSCHPFVSRLRHAKTHFTAFQEERLRTGNGCSRLDLCRSWYRTAFLQNLKSLLYPLTALTLPKTGIGARSADLAAGIQSSQG
jgi:hypothetical protein